MALSRTMRQATVGLLALITLGVLGWAGRALWNYRTGGGSYRAVIKFQSAGGMQPGTSVSYRGVRVGQIESVSPKPNGVDIEIGISPGTLLIPANSRIEANQSGLIGETAIDIVPLQDLDEASLALPLDPNCDSSIIICDGSELVGEDQLDINTLIRSVLRIADLIGSPEFVSNLNAVSRNASVTFAEIGDLSEELLTLLQNNPLEKPLDAVTGAASSVDDLLGELEAPLIASLESLDSTTNRIAEVIGTEGDTLRTTLVSIMVTSDRLQDAIGELTPVLVQVNQSEIVENFETLTRDAATAAANVRDVTGELNDPETIVQLQKTVDSAQAALENVLKISADVNELTGSEEFRDSIRELIEALGDLLSSTQHLERQVARAQFDRTLSEVSPASP